MAHIVTGRCVDCRYTDCCTVCPVDCFYEIEDPATLAATLGRLAPRGMKLRFDRRVDPSRRIGRSYGGWRALLWGEGLAGDVNGTEIHIRPAGVAPGAATVSPISRIDPCRAWNWVREPST